MRRFDRILHAVDYGKCKGRGGRDRRGVPILVVALAANGIVSRLIRIVKSRHKAARDKVIRIKKQKGIIFFLAFENAFEALLASIYLDSNGKEEVAKFLLPIIKSELETVGTDVNYDYKTSLQQFIQAIGNDRIQYACIKEEGPDHDKTFEVVVKINSNVVGTGKGKTKREAEQMAAKEALKLFDVK